MGIPIVYFRSSSLNCWKGCQQLYFLSYILGLDEVNGQKAEMGTIVHKTLEILANLKLEQQKNPDSPVLEITDSAIGKVTVPVEEFLEPYTMTPEEVEKTNKGMKSKSIYITKFDYKEDHVRYGVKSVEEIFERCFQYYMQRSTHKWTPARRRDCHNWTWGILDYNNDGSCDPRRQKIVAAEPFFDLEIKEEWAKVGDGYLSIKGTVDLITEVDIGGVKVLNVLDYKTGSRVDWNERGLPTKTYDKLQDDTQLMLYFYAVQHLYPDYEHAIINIVYVRDGGLFSICFEKEHLKVLEERVRQSFKEVTNCKVPELFDPNFRDFKCKNMCYFNKNKLEGTSDSICKHIHKEVKKKGIEQVMKEYTKEGHDIGHYQNPGE